MKRVLAVVLVALAVPAMAAAADRDPKREEWTKLFDGRSLEGWVPKITGYAVGENFANTFRVENGVLKVAYDGYEGPFDGRFGHLFFKTPFSHYRLVIEYRFVGEQATGGPEWAFRNSGVMIHGQPVETMQKDQDFPISIEVQLLGGRDSGERTHREPLHAGHERGDGRQARHGPLHQLDLEDLPRRPVGARRGRGPRRRPHRAQGRGADGAQLRAAADRRRQRRRSTTRR